MENSKELVELFKGLGYVGGEVHEITKDGVDLKDLKSVKDIIENRQILVDAFSGLNDVSVKGLSYEQLASIVLAAKEGFELGVK